MLTFLLQKTEVSQKKVTMYQPTELEVAELLKRTGPTEAWCDIVTVFKINPIAAIFATVFDDIVYTDRSPLTCPIFANIFVTAVRDATEIQLNEFIARWPRRAVIAVYRGYIGGCVTFERCRHTLLTAVSTRSHIKTTIKHIIAALKKEPNAAMMTLFTAVMEMLNSNIVAVNSQNAGILHNMTQDQVDTVSKLYPDMDVI